MQVLEDNWEDYIYISSVRFVKQVKKGALHETSPMLSDISGVPNWSKVLDPTHLLQTHTAQDCHENYTAIKCYIWLLNVTKLPDLDKCKQGSMLVSAEL